jgi:hypothetical protein
MVRINNSQARKTAGVAQTYVILPTRQAPSLISSFTGKQQGQSGSATTPEVSQRFEVI